MGNVCLGILNGTDVGLETSNIIGGTLLHALHVNVFSQLQIPMRLKPCKIILLLERKKAPFLYDFVDRYINAR